MFFTSCFAKAIVLTVLSIGSVSALPQASNENSLMVRAPCQPGYYLKNNVCTICPPGSTCDGTGAAQCDMGHAQPRNGTSGVCPQCPVGTFQPNRGATSCILCPKGQYASNNASSFCDNAPSGWFQSQPGKNFICGTCCGWEAMENGNINAKNCTGGKPNAWPNSGSGCIPSPANCVHAQSCSQDPITGACPPGSVTKASR
ncbi:hypothetical protein MSAN_01037900 [Mycena sanguinolenta]|uniref:Tyrosine-protein kinase ephrin type A/B receptor-like domain-containing protein n=1 Tax=Mycena sanguinolenta TaxID=230812 RepID=A0A8H6YTW5_9AGAR|nr:hypothetical protein MSAN_01037900 [Mycena sanguinolenta]